MYGAHVTHPTHGSRDYRREKKTLECVERMKSNVIVEQAALEMEAKACILFLFSLFTIMHKLLTIQN